MNDSLTPYFSSKNEKTPSTLHDIELREYHQLPKKRRNTATVLNVDQLRQRLIDDSSSDENSTPEFTSIELEEVQNWQKNLPAKKGHHKTVSFGRQPSGLGQPEPDSFSNAKKKLPEKILYYSIFCFIFTLIHVYSIWITIQAQPAREMADSILSSIMEEYKTDPIIDIQTVASSEICPHSFEPILLGKWPEAQASSSNLYTWNNNTFCIRRARLGEEYLQAHHCPKGYKTCSFGLCMEASTPCPVTSIEFTQTNTNSENNGFNSYLLKREHDKPALINLEVSFNQKTFLDKSDFPSPINFQISGVSELLDKELNMIIDWSNIKQIFNENNILEDPLPEQKAYLIGRRKLKTYEMEQCIGIEHHESLNQPVLYTGLILLQIAFGAYFVLMIPAAQAFFKHEEKFKRLSENRCIQAVIFIFFQIGSIFIWSSVFRPINASSQLVFDCFESPALNYILNIPKLMIETSRDLLIFDCIIMILPVLYFEIIRDKNNDNDENHEKSLPSLSK